MKRLGPSVTEPPPKTLLASGLSLRYLSYSPGSIALSSRFQSSSVNSHDLPVSCPWTYQAPSQEAVHKGQRASRCEVLECANRFNRLCAQAGALDEKIAHRQAVQLVDDPCPTVDPLDERLVYPNSGRLA